MESKAINDKNKVSESIVTINNNNFNPNSSKIDIIVSDDTNKNNKNEIQYEEIEYEKIKFHNIENPSIKYYLFNDLKIFLNSINLLFSKLKSYK